MVLDALSTSIVGPRPHTYFGLETSASKFKLLHPDFIGYVTERYGDRVGDGVPTSPLFPFHSDPTCPECFQLGLLHYALGQDPH